MKPLKVATIFGTRPEIIRLSRVMAALDRHVDQVLVHTGQNYDFELNEVFFSDLEVKQPDYFLGVAGGSLGETLGAILVQTEKVLKKERPDAVLVLGDTNSAISAIIARRMKIPVYHMEAGNRCFDKNVPEETNRRLVDHISDFNLTYTEHARRHLLSEGMEHRRVYVTGSPMREVLEHYRPHIDASDVLDRIGLTPGGYFIVSIHREENVDSKERLSSLIETLNTLAEKYDYPIILSTHPRTRKRLESIDALTLDNRIRTLKPFGFHDYNKLQMSCFCTISDSGTIVEESSILGFAAITPRDAIERPEGIDTGSLIMTGIDHATIVAAIEVVTAQHEARAAAGIAHPIPEDYTVMNTSERVLNLILGTAKLSNVWDGVRIHDYV